MIMKHFFYLSILWTHHLAAIYSFQIQPPRRRNASFRESRYILNPYSGRTWRGLLHSQPETVEEYEQIENNGQFNTLPRIYVGVTSNSLSRRNDDQSSSRLKTRARIQLSPEQTHYLTKVMRLFSKKKRSDKRDVLIRVFDGCSGEWLCRLLQPQPSNSDEKKESKKQRRQKNVPRTDHPLDAECLLQLRHQPSISIDKSPWLFFAPIKKQRAKFMVEKCTELGVGLFCPILTEFTDAGAINTLIGNVNAGDHSNDAMMFQDLNSDNRSKHDADKLSLVAQEAAEQCERLTVPEVASLSHIGKTNLMSTIELLEEWKTLGKDRLLMICRERKQGRHNVLPINNAMQEASTRNLSAAFLVGPEGGWSPEEEASFDRYCSNNQGSIMGVTLGSNVLRAETASMLAIGSYSLWLSSAEQIFNRDD